MRRLAAVAAAAVLLSLGLSACGEDDPELVEGVQEPVDALDNSFTPETITVQAGTEIQFSNKGRNDHNVVPAEDGSFDEITVEDLPPGGEPVTRRFTEPGTYDYFCSIHGTATSGMTGTITVEG